MTEKKFNSDNNFLKTYIMKQRFKKKQEMETSISLQKQKREEEMKRYRVQMNLDEIKSELNKLESKLRELKDQKHQLFSQLKKVLHEDDMRKRQWNANHAFFTAEQLGLAPGVQLAGAPNPLFGPHITPSFSAQANNPSLQFYSSNGQPIARPKPPPQQYQPNFNPHMMNKVPMDQRQMDQRQLDQRQMDQRQMDQRQMDQRQMDQRQMDQRQMDQRQMEQRQMEQRQMDQRQLDQRQLDQRQLDQRQMDQRQMAGPPPPPPSITAGTGIQRTMKRTHEESVAPNRGSRGVSPPVQAPTRHLDYKSIPVTYTPTIPTDSRHQFPGIHSQHWTQHPRHPFGWPQ